MTIKSKAQKNPIMAAITTLAALAIAAVAIAEGFQLADKLHMTEPEAAVIHLAFERALSDVGQKIDTQGNLNECRYLSDKIDRIAYEIYILRRDTASPDYIREKESALEKHRAKYDALGCVTLL